jgi:hypothetical protein
MLSHTLRKGLTRPSLTLFGSIIVHSMKSFLDGIMSSLQPTLKNGTPRHLVNWVAVKLHGYVAMTTGRYKKTVGHILRSQKRNSAGGNELFAPPQRNIPYAYMHMRCPVTLLIVVLCFYLAMSPSSMISQYTCFIAVAYPHFGRDFTFEHIKPS